MSKFKVEKENKIDWEVKFIYKLFNPNPKWLEAKLKYQFLNSSHKKDTY